MRGPMPVMQTRLSSGRIKDGTYGGRPAIFSALLLLRRQTTSDQRLVSLLPALVALAWNSTADRAVCLSVCHTSIQLRLTYRAVMLQQPSLFDRQTATTCRFTASLRSVRKYPVGRSVGWPVGRHSRSLVSYSAYR